MIIITDIGVMAWLVEVNTGPVTWNTGLVHSPHPPPSRLALTSNPYSVFSARLERTTSSFLVVMVLLPLQFLASLFTKYWTSYISISMKGSLGGLQASSILLGRTLVILSEVTVAGLSGSVVTRISADLGRSRATLLTPFSV